MKKNLNQFILPVAALLMAIGANAQTKIITTVAGTGTGAYSGDGTAATTAKLFSPSGVATDIAGNIYIADKTNARIRKINKTTGIISTVAGNGTPGYTGDNTAATLAEISQPTGVAVDATGNIYIADQGNNCIRKVSAAGIITTVAGGGSVLGDGGPATAGQISSPGAVALDASGNLYIADEGNNRIREVNKSTGIITTIAGTGTAAYSGDGIAATLAQLDYPSGVAVDASGNIYIADQVNNRIRKITAGIISTYAGAGLPIGFSGDGGAATLAQFDYPAGVAVDDSGYVYVTDGNNSVIRKINGLGVISTIAGNDTAGFSGDGGPSTAAKLNSPASVAIDTAGNIYIADVGNNRIRKAAKVVVSHTGVNIISAGNNNIAITPNPNKGTFTVTGSFHSPAEEPVSLQIIDMTGRVIYQNTAQAPGGILDTQITLNGITDGMYLLHIQSGTEMDVSRFVIQK